MTEQSKTYPLGEKGATLFSGGTDSTLAAYLLSQKVRHVTLLTFDPGFIFFIENSKAHVANLARVIGADRITHKIIPIRPIIDKILLGSKKEDFAKWGFNLTALVCLGCRLSMHTAGIVYCLENDIPVIVDGSIAKQATIPEQLASFIHRNRQMLWGHYGIRHFSPIYDEDHSDIKLDELGLSTKKELKRQFIFFDTQPTCPCGVTADVYARLFYGKLSGHAREVDAYTYSEEKYPLIHKVIDAYFETENIDPNSMTERMQKLSAPLPIDWPKETQS